MITLTTKEWTPIRRRLSEEYSWKPSVFMIRDVMKRELGFTIRHHSEWVGDGYSTNGYKESVCLDFYNEAMEIHFRLKYL